MFDEERCKFVAMIIMSINNSLSSLMALYLMFGGRDATVYLFISVLICMYSLIFIPIVPESPKLLYSQKNYEGTRQVLEKIAHVNGVKYKKLPFQEEIEHHKRLTNTDPDEIQNIKDFNEEEKKKADFKVLFTNFKFLINMGITIFVFMFNVFSMYMISFMIKYLPGDKYVNLFILGVADFVPSVMSGFVMLLLPTKTAMILVHGSICGFVVLHLFFGGIEWLGMPLIFFIRFAITLES